MLFNLSNVLFTSRANLSKYSLTSRDICLPEDFKTLFKILEASKSLLLRIFKSSSILVTSLCCAFDSARYQQLILKIYQNVHFLKS